MKATGSAVLFISSSIPGGAIHPWATCGERLALLFSKSVRVLTDALNGHTSLPPSPRKPLPAVASLTHAWAASPAACEFEGSCTSVCSCHQRPWDRLNSFPRTAKPSCCHTLGTSSIEFWLALLKLVKSGSARLARCCRMARTPAIWANP